MTYLLLTAAWLMQSLHPVPVVPDDSLTPGAIGETNQAKVCVADYSTTVRHTSKRLKAAVFAEYHLTRRQCGHCEVDHRVPLLLGGADVRENLWPQSYNVTMGAYEKDALEVRIHVAVCHEHSMTLAEGQKVFLGDWISAYKVWFPVGGK